MDERVIQAALVAYERPMRADGAIDKRWPAMQAAIAAADAERAEQVREAVATLIHASGQDAVLARTRPDIHGQWSVDDVMRARHKLLSLVGALETT